MEELFERVAFVLPWDAGKKKRGSNHSKYIVTFDHGPSQMYKIGVSMVAPTIPLRGNFEVQLGTFSIRNLLRKLLSVGTPTEILGTLNFERFQFWSQFPVLMDGILLSSW